MSNKSLFYLVLFILAGTFHISCKSSKQIRTQEASDVLEIKQGYVPWQNHLGWAISGNGLKHSSYIFGTMHIIPIEDYFLPEGVEAAFDASDKVVFEIDMREMSDMGAMMDLVMGAFMKDGKTLKDLMTEKDYKEVSAHFEKMGLPMMMMERIKPMFLSMFASPAFNPSDLQNGEWVSYETKFFERATASEKQIGGVETLAYQMGLFDSIPYKAQADMLLEAIRSSSTETDLLRETLALYKEQDIEQMVSLMAKDESGMMGFEDILLNGRNQNWIPEMEKEMRAQKTFFAVGAGHLGGPEGVLYLLRLKGYQIKPL